MNLYIDTLIPANAGGIGLKGWYHSINADLWVPSTQCPAQVCPYTRFDSTTSSTFTPTNQSFSITYGIGNVNGTYATDTIHLAGGAVSNQQFGLASTSQNILTNPTTVGSNGGGSAPPKDSGPNAVVGNGILGMGFPQLTTAANSGGNPYYPVIFNMVDQKIISNPIFSIYMNRADASGWAGEIILGGVDSSKYSGDIVYLPVAFLAPSSSSGSSSSSNQILNNYKGYYYWMVFGQGLSVTNNGVTTNFNLPSVGAFIIDTGTTLTYLPQNMANSIVNAVAGSNGFKLDTSSSTYLVDCNAVQSKATIQLRMSPSSKGTSSPVILSVPASNLIIPLDAATADKASVCIFGIAPANSGGVSLSSQMYLIGDSVLRSAYLAFDMGGKRIGFAAANGVGGSVTTNGTIPQSQNNANGMSPSLSFPALVIFIFAAITYL
ncbi:aspartic peptidase domain-containing protein [Spinellus fusiger]|nr:aspartic peptidase domain-containing protein [Spinellus fusiger]